MEMRLILSVGACVLALGGCKDDPAPPPPAPTIASANDVASEPEDIAPAHPVEDVAVDEGPTGPPWTPAAVPADLMGPQPARAVLEQLARGGFTADIVDEAHGVYVAAVGQAPEWLSGAALTARTRGLRGTLRGALRDGSPEAVACIGSLCRAQAPEKSVTWFVQTRGDKDGKRDIAGVLEVTDQPQLPRYYEWFSAVRDKWLEPTHDLLGVALSAEEGGTMDTALANLTAALETDPESPWPLLHRARVRSTMGDHKGAYLDLRVLTTRNNPAAMSALVTASGDPGLTKLREHTAVDETLAETRLAPPSSLADFVAYLQRMRAVPSRLRQATLAGRVPWDELSRVLETYLFYEPTLDEEALTVTWPDPSGARVRLELMRDAKGRLKVRDVVELDRQ